MQKRLDALWNSRAQESSVLDYKQAPYPTTEGGRKEFAKDIAAFANRNGGTLVIGVAEEAGAPAAVVGIEGSNLDEVIMWLESVSRSGVYPHIPNLAIVPVLLEGKHVVLVDVPPGSEGLYEVPSAGKRFFVRDERSVRHMSREEIKYAVRKEALLEERIERFAHDVWASVCNPLSGLQASFRPDQSGCQLLAFPIFDEAFQFKANVAELAKRHPAIPAFDGRDLLVKRPTIDGVRYIDQVPREDALYGFATIFKHGVVQIVDGYTTQPYSTSYDETKVYAGEMILRALSSSAIRSIKMSEELTGASQFILDFRFKAQVGTPVVFYEKAFSRLRQIADRPEMIFDKVMISTSGDWEADFQNSIKPLFDQFWQAFGFDRCLYYGDDGSFKQW